MISERNFAMETWKFYQQDSRHGTTLCTPSERLTNTPSYAIVPSIQFLTHEHPPRYPRQQGRAARILPSLEFPRSLWEEISATKCSSPSQSFPPWVVSAFFVNVRSACILMEEKTPMSSTLKKEISCTCFWQVPITLPPTEHFGSRCFFTLSLDAMELGVLGPTWLVEMHEPEL